MKVRMVWNNNSSIFNKWRTQPFKGRYIDFERVPNISETITLFDNTYTVKRVDTKIDAWKFYYTLYIE